ncbi:hypothetical protein P8452_07499 [Trifolium repens]|nr:hypothetical protein P8452_07499 [Trifolium repens]
MFTADTGIPVDRSMVVELPDFAQLNPRRRRKKRTKKVEEILTEEEDMSAEEAAAESSEKKVEKERRSKKRNERPLESSDSDDHATLSSRLRIKKQKVAGSAQASETVPKAGKGKVSKTKMISIPEAHVKPSSLPKPTSIQTIAQPETVNVLSDFENTLSDSDLQGIINLASNFAEALAPEDHEVASEDISLINQLSYHISGDAFTSSKQNSPANQLNVATPMHIDSQPSPSLSIHQTSEPTNSLPLYPISIETLSSSSDIETIPLQLQPLSTLVLETLLINSIDVEETSQFIPLHKIQIKPPTCAPKHLPLPYSKPYDFFINNEPVPELLSNAFYSSLLSLKDMEKEALVFPSDIIAEGAALKARIYDVVDSMCMHLSEKVEGSGIAVINTLMNIAQNVNPPRLTNSVDLDVNEQAIVNLIDRTIVEDFTAEEEELSRIEQAQVQEAMEVEASESDRGKNPIQDTTPPATPIRTSREFGTSSSTLDPELREILSAQQAQIDSLGQERQADRDTMSLILSMLSDIQKRLPNP